MIDVINHRQILAKARTYVRAVPFAWSAYGIYWRIRSWIEARRLYRLDRKLLDFGRYPEPTLETPTSQLCTSSQLRSPIYRSWCSAMHSPARFSRKQWEFVYILQVLHSAGMLEPGKKGLGFGCGREPLAGLLAQHGCDILATDLAQDLAMEQGWVNTMQHASSLEGLYSAAQEFISRQDFENHVQFLSVDMNVVPREFHGSFDFVWSACALEHLGSLQHGLNFIKNSVRCLNPGGVAVHTTEFNLSSNEDTCEEPGCSIYRACDLQRLITELEADGFAVAPLNLNTGSGQVDNHIDVPPYGFSPHLKLLLSGYVVTSIGLIIRRLQ
jgi:SAM-dependent methyltransferase